MPYSVKLKDQTGAEVIYKSVEKVLLPLDTGTGNAEFMAKYNVKVSSSELQNITVTGGDSAAHNVDYVCFMAIAKALEYFSENIQVLVGNETISSENYEYTIYDLSNISCGLLKIKGSAITGDITIVPSFR